MSMSSHKTPISLYTLFLLTVLVLGFYVPANSSQRRIHVTDDLDDVVDDEEDEEWKQWGSKKSRSQEEKFDPPDFSNMELSEIQEEMMKRHVGPTFGFVKLRLGVPRTKSSQDMVSEIAMKWTKILKTGAVEATFMAVDLSTIMFTMTRGQDTMELKEYLLDQPEAYEIKIGDRVFRRPGDPPLEEVLEKLHQEKQKAQGESTPKEEL